MTTQLLNATPDPHGITMPLTKVAVSAGSAAAVNADRIASAMTGATDWSNHPLLQLTWQNFSAFAATLVSVCVLCDWWWKRFWRPLFESRGWIKPKPRRKLTPSQLADLIDQSNDQG